MPDIRLQVFRAFAPVALRSVGLLLAPGVDSYAKPSRSCPTIQVLFCVAELWKWYARLPRFLAQRIYVETMTARARGTPDKSLRQAAGASPIAAVNDGTASSCPAPSSSTSTPPGASSRRASAAIAR